MKKFILLLSLVSFLQHSSTLAWGTEGHHLVAEIAFRKLSDQAKANVMNFLGTTTIEQASVWMDEMRSNKEYDFMKPWHYINIEKGVQYLPSTEENIVNEIIEKQRELMHFKTLCSDQVKTDVMILFHLIGDLHQPLHAGYGIDRGGNNVQVNFMGEGSNLHWVWDTKIIEQEKINLESCLQLMQGLNPDQISAIKAYDVSSWMMGSRSYLDSVYSFTGNVLGEEYTQKNRHIVEQQLVYGGLRLAAVLEQIFGTTNSTSKASPELPVNKSGTITTEDAINHVGETITVCGKVFGGKYLDHANGKPTFINMGAAYPNSPFTLVIFGSDRGSFSYAPEQFLDNKNICVTGLIKLYKGKPEIIVNKESQIEMK